MATNNNVNRSDSTAFVDEDANSGFKFKDFVFLVLHNLHWFVLCALIGGLISYYKVKREEKIYASSATMMVKTNYSGGSESFRSSMTINALSGQNVIFSSINNEIMVLKSQTSMENMVRKLNLNLVYSYQTKVAKRIKVLYKDSPIEVEFLDLDEQTWASFNVTPFDEKQVLVENLGEGFPSMNVNLNDTVVLPMGRVVITPTWRYADFKDVSIIVQHQALSAVAASYRSRISVVRENEKNSILVLSLADTSPLRAADALNTLIDVYNQESIDDQKRVLSFTEKFINDRIDFLMSDIEDFQQSNIDFMRSHNIIDTKTFGQNYMATSTAATAEAKKLSEQSGMVRYLITFVQENPDQVIPVGVGNLNSDATSLIAEYNRNLLEIEKYKADGITNNPTVQNLMDMHNSMKSNILSVLESNLIALQERLDAANRERNIANSQIQTVPSAQVELSSASRKQDIKENLYLQLLTKREELLLMTPQLEATGKVIDYATPNYSPIAPNEKKSTMMGILIGLAIPALIMLLIRLLDTTIHTKADVQKASNVPILGDVPFEKDIPKHAVMVRENGRDSLSESFRLIRSSLEYMKDRKEGAHVVMFTSFMVSSGKTFISTNLATSFALASRKVVLVDLDIRKGTFFKVYDISTRAGVSNYLSGKTDNVDDIIHPDSSVPNMDIIFSGPVPPNPAELLMSDRLDIMINELRQRYDYVFLDNVPLGMVADADIVKRVADTTILVLRAGKTDKRLLFDVDKMYKDGTFPNLCVVLNSVNKKRRGYGHYGYGYGYGNEEMEKKKKRFRLFHRKHHHHHHRHQSSSSNKDKE